MLTLLSNTFTFVYCISKCNSTFRFILEINPTSASYIYKSILTFIRYVSKSTLRLYLHFKLILRVVHLGIGPQYRSHTQLDGIGVQYHLYHVTWPLVLGLNTARTSNLTVLGSNTICTTWRNHWYWALILFGMWYSNGIGAVNILIIQY